MQETQASVILRDKFVEALARFVARTTSTDAFVGELMSAVGSTPMLVLEYGGTVLKVIETDFNDTFDECQGYTVWTEMDPEDMEADDDEDL